MTTPSQDQINALINLYNSGRMTEAERACRKLLRAYPQSLIVLNVLGAALKGQHKLQEAVQVLDKFIKLKPDHADAYFDRGAALKEMGQLEEAVMNYNKAIQLKPDDAEAYCNRGAALQELGHLEEAIKSHNMAIQLKPDFSMAYNNRGCALQELGQLEEAIKSHNMAIQLKPDYAEAYNGRGTVLQELGQLEEAMVSCNRAIQLKPDYAVAHFNLSLMLLLQGNFKDGWREYEWRLRTKDFISQNRNFIQSQWDGLSLDGLSLDGLSLDGKTILLHAEHGVGDEVMFSSCVPDLVAKNPKQIILECDLRLAPLFARSFPEVDVRGKRGEKDLDWLKEFGDIDFQVATGSLPSYFRSDFDLFPDRKSFLKPATELLVKWRSRYAEMGEGMKIGVSWRGGTKERIKGIRSIELQLLEPIFQSGVHFVNLQYGDCAEEINQLERKMGVHIHDWDDANPLTNLDDFTAQIAALDLVISIDNSTVHFAGAVGIPTWVLTPYVPDWRWLLERDDSPWYPTIRLFRQRMHRDWSYVISEVKTELNKYSGSYAVHNVH